VQALSRLGQRCRFTRAVFRSAGQMQQSRRAPRQRCCSIRHSSISPAIGRVGHPCCLWGTACVWRRPTDSTRVGSADRPYRQRTGPAMVSALDTCGSCRVVVAGIPLRHPSSPVLSIEGKDPFAAFAWKPRRGRPKSSLSWLAFLVLVADEGAGPRRRLGPASRGDQRASRSGPAAGSSGTFSRLAWRWGSDTSPVTTSACLRPTKRWLRRRRSA
jgi:hypothetical protein